MVIRTTLIDAATGGSSVDIEIGKESRGIHIKAKGFSTFDLENGPIVLLEQYGGKLHLIVWADIKSQDPTHIIDLEQAREEVRR